MRPASRSRIKPTRLTLSLSDPPGHFIPHPPYDALHDRERLKSAAHWTEPQHHRVHGGLGRSHRKHRAEGCGVTRNDMVDTLCGQRDNDFVGQDADYRYVMAHAIERWR